MAFSSDKSSEVQTSRAVAEERPELLVCCGLAGLIGACVMTVGVLILQFVHPDHNPVADTISDLARGDAGIWMDVAFYVNAAGMLALAIAAAHVHLGRMWWSVGIFALAGIALVVVLLGVWDEFNQDPSDAWSVHTRLSIVLWPLFALGPLAMARGAGEEAPVYAKLLVASGLLWTVSAPVFFFVPTGVDGLVERIVGVFTLGWVGPLAWLFLARGRAAMR